MAILTVNDTTPRVQYTATSGQTVFTYPFAIFQDSDLKVYNGSTLKTLATDYTVSGAGGSSGGNVTFGSGLTAGDIVTIYRDLPVARTTDYQANGDLLAENLNDDLDKAVMMVQQIEDQLENRTIRFTPWVDGAPNELNESAAARANKALIFDSSGNPAVSNDDYNDQLTNVTAQASAAAQSAADAGASEVAAAQSALTASGHSDDADTARIAAQAAQTAAETAQTNAEGYTLSAQGYASNASVSENNASTSASNASASETNAANSVAQALIYLTQIQGVQIDTAAALRIADEIVTVAGLELELMGVAGMESNIQSLLANMASIDRVVEIESAVVGVDDNEQSIINVYLNLSQILMVAAISADVTTVAGMTADVSTVAGVAGDISTCAGNITAIQNAPTEAGNAAASASAAAASYDAFDDRYLGAKSADPTLDNDGDPLQTGALYFNTTSAVMKVYGGSSWVAAYASSSGAMMGVNNLADVDDISASVTNLGLDPTIHLASSVQTDNDFGISLL